MIYAHHNFGSFGRCLAHHLKEWLDDIGIIIGNGADAVTEMGHVNIHSMKKLGTNPLGLVQCIGYGIDQNIDTVGRG